MHGDFIGRGLSPAERLWWDERLSIGLARAAAATGDAFPALWDAMPSWRFRLPQKPYGISGAIAMSVDRSGRRFPVILARHDGRSAVACEAALRRGLTERLAADVILSGIDDRVDDGAFSAPSGWWRGEGPCGSLLTDLDPAAALPLMFAHVVGGLQRGARA